MAIIDVYNQDELDRVLANAHGDVAVRLHGAEGGAIVDYTIAKDAHAIIKVAPGARLKATVPDLTVDVEGGKFDGGMCPQHLFISSGTAENVGRGSRITATGGAVFERGGASGARSSGRFEGNAQGEVSSGSFDVHNDARLIAGGDAQVFAYDNARVDSYAKAKVRADDNAEVRAHEHSEAHLHGRSRAFGNGASTVTMVSPTSDAMMSEGTHLIVAESVPSHRYLTPTTPTVVKDEIAKLPDTLREIESQGRSAYHKGAMAAPALNAKVREIMEGREVGDPITAAVMEAFTQGYRSQADAASAMVTAVDNAKEDPRPTTAAMEGMELASKNMWADLPYAEQPTHEQVAAKYGKAFADGYAKKWKQLTGQDMKSATTDIATTEPAEKYLVYTDASGKPHYQPVSDIPDNGTLIDPVTGDDMDVVGWTDSYDGDVRTDPMDIIYEDSNGNQHAQPWGDVVQSGGLIDDEGADMRVVGGLGDTGNEPTGYGDEKVCPSCANVMFAVPAEGSHGYRWSHDASEYEECPDDEESCCAGCDCGQGCATGCKVGPVCPEYADKPSLEEQVAATRCVKCRYLVEDCMCFSGPTMPSESSSTTAVPAEGIGFDGNCTLCGDPFVIEGRETHHIFPTGEINHDADASHRAQGESRDYPLTAGDKIVQIGDDTLVKLRYRNGDPDLVTKFDWVRRRWGRSMTTSVGSGKALVEELRSLSPADRAVTKEAASAFSKTTGGFCLMCGRHLSDDASRARGYGPECATKLR